MNDLIKEALQGAWLAATSASNHDLRIHEVIAGASGDSPRFNLVNNSMEESIDDLTFAELLGELVKHAYAAGYSKGVTETMNAQK